MSEWHFVRNEQRIIWLVPVPHAHRGPQRGRNDASQIFASSRPEREKGGRNAASISRVARIQ